MSEKTGGGPTNEQEFNNMVDAAKGSELNASMFEYAKAVEVQRLNTLKQKGLRLAYEAEDTELWDIISNITVVPDEKVDKNAGEMNEPKFKSLYLPNEE